MKHIPYKSHSLHTKNKKTLKMNKVFTELRVKKFFWLPILILLYIHSKDYQDKKTKESPIKLFQH
jgi:hypothetical protein